MRNPLFTTVPFFVVVGILLASTHMYLIVRGEVKISSSTVQAASAACPRLICVNTHVDGGLGHRVVNLLQGILLSLALDVPLAVPRLEVGVGAFHGEYAGADDIFRPINGDNFLRCPRNFSELPPGWKVNVLGLSHEIIEALPNATPALRDSTSMCGTIHVVHEFWPARYTAAVAQLRAMYCPSSATGSMLLAALRYDAARFNIAVHIRVGDIVPTPLDYFPAVLERVLAELDPLLRQPLEPLPVDVWIFAESEYPWAIFAPVVQQIVSGGVSQATINTPADLTQLHTASAADVRLRPYPANLSALATLVHLIESDIFIGSGSTLSLIAAFLATGPVVLTAPNFYDPNSTFENFIPGNIRVSADLIFESGHVLTRAQRWLKSQSVVRGDHHYVRKRSIEDG